LGPFKPGRGPGKSYKLLDVSQQQLLKDSGMAIATYFHGDNRESGCEYKENSAKPL